MQIQSTQPLSSLLQSTVQTTKGTFLLKFNYVSHSSFFLKIISTPRCLITNNSPFISVDKKVAP